MVRPCAGLPVHNLVANPRLARAAEQERRLAKAAYQATERGIPDVRDTRTYAEYVKLERIDAPESGETRETNVGVHVSPDALQVSSAVAGSSDFLRYQGFSSTQLRAGLSHLLGAA